MTIPVRYVGSIYDEITINAISPDGVPVAIQVAAGETVDAPEWLAGQAPTGEHPGVGLLAQPANWAPADQPTIDSAQADEHDDDSTGEPGETGATR